IVVVATLVFIDAVEDGYEELSPRQSGQHIATLMQHHLAPQTRVYSVGYYDQTLPFYLKREVTLAGYVDEFALGQMQPGLYEKLAGEGVAFRLLHQDERRAVVMKPSSR